MSKKSKRKVSKKRKITKSRAKREIKDYEPKKKIYMSAPSFRSKYQIESQFGGKFRRRVHYAEKYINLPIYKHNAIEQIDSLKDYLRNNIKKYQRGIYFRIIMGYDVFKTKYTLLAKDDAYSTKIDSIGDIEIDYMLDAIEGYLMSMLYNHSVHHIVVNFVAVKFYEYALEKVEE